MTRRRRWMQSSTHVPRLAAGLIVAGLVCAPLAGIASASPVTVPYTDPSSTGSITLCDLGGHSLLSGSITTKPFAWKAVGSAPASAPYNGAGALATLYIFIPVQGLPPSYWNGDNMTAASAYTNPAHPAAQATSLDFSLRDFLGNFRTPWNNLLQLRLLESSPANGGPAPTYNALTIQVHGGTWSVVGPIGSAPCSSSVTLSHEVAAEGLSPNGVAPPRGSKASATRSTAQPGHYGTADDPVPGSTAGGAAPQSSNASPGSVAGSPTGQASSDTGGSHSSAPWVVVAVTLGLLAGGVAVVRWIGRRRV